LPDLKLRLGDGVLLYGPREKAALLESDPDFVVLSEGAPAGPYRPKYAPFALGSLLLMVVLVVAGSFPIQAAAFTAATLVVLTRALKMQEAYRAVEWRSVFLVAAILPVGVAMERTGAAQFLADSVAHLAGGAGGYKAMDYVKVGTPLTVVVLGLLAFMIPLLLPFEV
jgi:di/tricarboxylate transporter